MFKVVVISVFCLVRVSISPDSGISSQPSPVSLPENCLVTTDAMVLRSQRLVRSTATDDCYDEI